MPDTLEVADWIKTIISFINLQILTPSICIIGMISNIVNIVVFYKQGLHSTVNISFMALTIADLCNVVVLEWSCVSTINLFDTFPELTIFLTDIAYLTGGFPHGCLSRITAWITVYMTAERFICIVMPFKVKNMFTSKGTTITIITISSLTVLPLIPEYCFFYIDWTYFPHLNKTLLGLVPHMDRPQLEGVSFLVYALMMFTSFPVIIVLTIVLILQLRKLSKWRQNSYITSGQSNNLDLKDKMAMRTVVVIACVLIVTFTPTVIFSVLSYAIPGFQIKGKYSNAYMVLVSFAFLFDSINASFNTILYYVMNSNFRKTFHQICNFRVGKTSRK